VLFIPHRSLTPAVSSSPSPSHLPSIEPTPQRHPAHHLVHWLRARVPPYHPPPICSLVRSDAILTRFSQYYYNPDLSPNLDCNTVAPNTFSMYSTNMRTTTASFNSTTNVTSYTYSWVQPSNTFGFSASSNPSSTNYIDQCIKYTDTTWRKFTCVGAPP